MTALPICSAADPTTLCAPDRTKNKLLEAVKRSPCATAQTLASELGLTVPAIRRHLQDLQDAGLLKLRLEKPGGRGRPQHVYSLSELGEATFPKAYAALCVNVLAHLDTLFGEGAMLQVLDARRLELLALLSPRVNTQPTLGGKVQALAEALDELGYAARAEQHGGQWYLTEHNCPAPAVARAFPELCQSELTLYQQLLGAPVVRESRISCGAAQCRYKVG